MLLRCLALFVVCCLRWSCLHCIDDHYFALELLTVVVQEQPPYLCTVGHPFYTRTDVESLQYGPNVVYIPPELASNSFPDDLKACQKGTAAYCLGAVFWEVSVRAPPLCIRAYAATAFL